MAGANGSVVLVVDDKPATRIFLRDILTGAGFGCVEAADGESGLRLAARHPISTAVVALQLPGIDGLELAWRLHRERPALCIVGLSDYADLWDAPRLRGLGIRRVLSAPFGPEELLGAICLSAAPVRSGSAHDCQVPPGGSYRTWERRAPPRRVASVEEPDATRPISIGARSERGASTPRRAALVNEPGATRSAALPDEAGDGRAPVCVRRTGRRAVFPERIPVRIRGP